GADWLQGPYVYSLYHEQYAFPERMVAILFVTGFVSAGLSAPLVGVWADQYGRRRLCLMFCVTYSLTCGLLLVPSLPVLLLGRVLGGISTSILFSAFESWLVSASSTAALQSEDLSAIMGRATLVNGFVAAAAGVSSNTLVEWNGGGYRSPFIASGVLLVLAWIVIRGTWGENYGGGGGAQVSTDDIFQIKRLGAAWKIVAADPTLLVLGLTQTIFEGSMYLFVFIWVPALQACSITPTSIPLGYVFSAFMISMMLGSLFYTFITLHWHRPPPPHLQHTRSLSSLVCAVSALAFAASVSAGRTKGEGNAEMVKFWAFCLFEACVGMYYPVQGMLRGSLIANEHRATLSALFRVPLNIFVVASLLTGVSSARDFVLIACAVVLALSAVTT
ncbi:MFS sugar transporter, partial [Heterobasidion irregulare TC 32-1]